MTRSRQAQGKWWLALEQDGVAILRNTWYSGLFLTREKSLAPTKPRSQRPPILGVRTAGRLIGAGAGLVFVAAWAIVSHTAAIIAVVAWAIVCFVAFMTLMRRTVWVWNPSDDAGLLEPVRALVSVLGTSARSGTPLAAPSDVDRLAEALLAQDREASLRFGRGALLTGGPGSDIDDVGADSARLRGVVREMTDSHKWVLSMERWMVYDALSSDGRHSGVLALRPDVIVWSSPGWLFHRRKSRKSEEVYEWIFIHHANGEGENFDDSHTSREEIDKELAMGTFLLRGIEYRLERMDPLREKTFTEEVLL